MQPDKKPEMCLRTFETLLVVFAMAALRQAASADDADLSAFHDFGDRDGLVRIADDQVTRAHADPRIAHHFEKINERRA